MKKKKVILSNNGKERYVKLRAEQWLVTRVLQLLIIEITNIPLSLLSPPSSLFHNTYTHTKKHTHTHTHTHSHKYKHTRTLSPSLSLKICKTRH